MSKAIRVGSVLAALALLLSPSTVAAAAWAPQVDLSTSGAGPRVAVNASGDAVVVWNASDGANSIVRAAIKRPGQPFSEALDLSAPGADASQADVAISDSGEAIAVWRRGRVIQAAIRPGWSPSFFAHDDLSDARENPGLPDVAINYRGDAVVAWATDGIWIRAATRDLGGLFEPPAVITTGVNVDSPRVAIGQGGDSVVVWRRPSGTNSVIQAATRSLDGRFGPPVNISAPGGQADSPELALDRGDTAVAAWRQLNGTTRVIEVATRPAGATFGGSEQVSPAGIDSASPQVAAGRDGDAVVTWERPLPTGASTIQSALRTGGHFLPAEDVTVSGVSTDPRVAINEARDKVAVWRNAGPDEYRAQATIGRPFFTPAVDISRPGHFVIRPAVGIDGSGNALAVWDAYTAGSGFSRIEARVYDATPPELDALSVPPTGFVGTPLAFLATASDSWSPVTAEWAFGDGESEAGLTPTHTFTEPGTYRVEVTVRDAAGHVTGAQRTITIEPPPPAPPGAGEPPPAAGAPAPAPGASMPPPGIAPRVAKLRVAPAAFTKHTRISFRLNRAARVKFQVQQQRGRRRRFVTLRGGFARASAAGANRFTFDGRLRGRRLRPGRYLLTAVPDVAGVPGARARARFRVLG